MRFSIQSLTFCLLSTQAGLAFAGPCKPRTTSSGAITTTTLAEASTTTTVSEESATTLVQDTTITVGEESTTGFTGLSTTATLSDETTTTLADLSTTITLGDVSTTTTFAEESTTETAAETTTTTFVEESTTTTLAETTTTTTAMGFEGTPLSAIFDDGSEMKGYLGERDSNGAFVKSTEEGSVPAIFSLEPETSRLFATLSDGSKLYAVTVIPDGPNYALIFDVAENIEAYNFYHYVTCTEDDDKLLSCQSEGGQTAISWYYTDDNQVYYGTRYPEGLTYPFVRFRI
ncbi:hypothetical protein NW762_014808 [Fusarium torreyae]|uniref:Uncharacterized protein n=1 Tax=Fusarium torreyae TaxID=1237075 RepID=A0A9W8RLL6_9HYPO|nr:hypothetical protein NW762_014808 [Fusarium torreyae]